MNTSMESLYSLGDENLNFAVSDDVMGRVKKNYLDYMTQSHSQKVYGLHTHYGANVEQLSNPLLWAQHQDELLNYLCVGVGKALPDSVVRRALRLQVNKLGKAVSGIHPETLQNLISLTNKKTLPQVPQFGSLGASGDLISMAHAVRPIFETYGIKGPRDVISCVNTNAMMSSLAIEICPTVKTLLNDALQITAMISKSINAPAEAYDEKLLSLGANSRHTVIVADKINQEIENIKIDFTEASTLLQQRYSLRCSPQIFAHSLRLLHWAEEMIIDEALAVADNPVCVSDSLDNKVLHGGLFYAIGLASAADFMNEAVARVIEVLDRQVLILMDQNLNSGMPMNLKTNEDYHVKGLHQLVSSLLQKARGLMLPSRAMSFSCESNNQDVVPCGMNALLQLQELVELSQDIIKAGY